MQQTKDADGAHAVHARKHGLNNNVGVVGKKLAVIGAVGGGERHHKRHVGGLLGNGHAKLLHLLWKLSGGGLHAVKNINRAGVQVIANLKRDGDHAVAIVGAVGRHVNHAFRAVNLLLQWHGHRVGNRQRVRAVIGGRHLNRWRHNIWKLRNWQHKHGNSAGQCGDDRNDAGENWTVDEEANHGDVCVVELFFRGLGGGWRGGGWRGGSCGRGCRGGFRKLVHINNLGSGLQPLNAVHHNAVANFGTA